jgi:alkane 1-monooxygenase
MMLQALIAQVLIFAVNYFEHWGLVRVGKRPTAAIAWQSDAWLTHFALLGLPRHADHHLHAARPFARLERHEESPLLPCGYFKMAMLVVFRNREARRVMERELLRRGLSGAPCAPRGSGTTARGTG